MLVYDSDEVRVEFEHTMQLSIVRVYEIDSVTSPLQPAVAVTVIG